MSLHIQNNLLRCYIFWFFHLCYYILFEENDFICFDKNVSALHYGFLRVYFSRMEIYFSPFRLLYSIVGHDVWSLCRSQTYKRKKRYIWRTFLSYFGLNSNKSSHSLSKSKVLGLLINVTSSKRCQHSFYFSLEPMMFHFDIDVRRFRDFLKESL